MEWIGAGIGSLTLLYLVARFLGSVWSFFQKVDNAAENLNAIPGLLTAVENVETKVDQLAKGHEAIKDEQKRVDNKLVDHMSQEAKREERVEARLNDMGGQLKGMSSTLTEIAGWRQAAES